MQICRDAVVNCNPRHLPLHSQVLALPLPRFPAHFATGSVLALTQQQCSTLRRHLLECEAVQLTAWPEIQAIAANLTGVLQMVGGARCRHQAKASIYSSF